MIDDWDEETDGDDDEQPCFVWIALGLADD
jgi:hypothetical protein